MTPASGTGTFAPVSAGSCPVGPLRIGRLVLRSRRPHVMLLPSGYEPTLVYLVECRDDLDGDTGQLGTFRTEVEAAACRARLESEGWQNLQINLVPNFMSACLTGNGTV